MQRSLQQAACTPNQDQVSGAIDGSSRLGRMLVVPVIAALPMALLTFVSESYYS